MKKLHVLLICVSAFLLGIVVGKISAPSVDAKETTKTSLPGSSASTQEFLKTGRSIGETEPMSESAVRLPARSRAGDGTGVPSFAYDSSVPLKRVIGETVMMVPTESLRNAGRSTLADALQTQFWAIAGGDVASLAEGIALDDTAKEIITKLMASAPPAVRAEYTSPEKFAALLLASNFRNLRGFTADRQRPINESETIATVSTMADGQDRSYTHTAHFLKASDGTWRRLINGKTATSMVLAHALGELPK